MIKRTKLVFENRKAAIRWLNSQNAALAGATPLSLLDTEAGVASVIDMLGRIDHGVYF